VQQRALAAALGLAVVGAALLAVLTSRGADPSPAKPDTTEAKRRAGGRTAVRSRRVTAAPQRSTAAFTVRGAPARRARIPILMYHVVSAASPGTPNPELWVAQDAFRAEMGALHRRGYVAITLQEAHAAWTGRGRLPRRPVVVTFDDGYLSDYTHARPVLRRLGWPGVLNLVVHNIGRGGLTAHQVRALLRDGWELDSHTIDHLDLTTLGPAALRRQLVESRRELRKRFGAPVNFFCYPSGRLNPTVVAAVRAAGYTAATTTAEGFASATQGFELARVRVNGSDTAATLLAKLRAEGSRPAT